ncbi:Wzz/FepE/Etk N-terminal domain-containing protein [Rhodococcus sp. NPDC003322]
MLELREFLQIARFRWRIIVATTALGAVALGLVAFLTPTQYTASTRLFVSSASDISRYDAQQGGIYAQERVVSYQNLINSRVLAQRTIDALGLDVDADSLAAGVTARSAPDAAVMDVSAVGDSPEQARDVTNTLASEFVRLASELETPQNGGAPVAKVVIIDPAEDGVPGGLHLGPRSIALGALLGMLVGLVLAFIRERLDDRIRNRDAVERVTGAAPLAELPSEDEADSSLQADTAEAYRRLRVNLPASGSDVIPVVIAVSSVGCGASGPRTVVRMAEGLAVSCAEEGTPTLLVVADPAFDDTERAYVAGTGRTSEIPQHVASAVEAVRSSLDIPRPTQFTGVFAMTRLPDAAPGALSNREGVTELFGVLRTHFRRIVVAIPEAAGSTEAVVIASAADGVILVGAYRSTTGRELQGSIEYLGRTDATVLGSVFVRRLVKHVGPRPLQSARELSFPLQPETVAGAES